MAEFKIGRLRFTWAGPWEADKFYNRDAVSQYNGKTYVCVIPHTSNADFYHDLYFVTPGGASTPYWEVMVEGKTWKGPWQAHTDYSLGNIIIYGGNTYVCVGHHNSGNSFDATKWESYVETDTWHPQWHTSHVYGKGDVVKYGGIVYRCINNHTSATNIASGLEENLNDWEIVLSGIEYKGDWNNTTKYKLNDLVNDGTNIWICTVGHPANATFDGAKWAMWLPGFVYEGLWNSATNYQPGDVVKYGGYTYTNNIINNANIVPSVNSVEWTILTQGYTVRDEWSAGQSYKIGDVVSKHGILFEAVSDNNGRDPTAYSIDTTYQYSTYNWTVANITATITPAATNVMVISPGVDTNVILSWEIGQSFTVVVNGGQYTDSYTLAVPVFLDGGNYIAIFNEANVHYGTVTAITFTSGILGTTINVASTAGITKGMHVVGANFTGAQYVTSVNSPTQVTVSSAPNTKLTNNTALKFVGVNYVYWKVLTLGNYWTNRWQQYVDYSVGDIVVWQNGTYVCIKNHTSGGTTGLRPDADTSNTLWADYVLHARKNALNTLGDFEYHSGTENVALPIGPQDYVMKVENSVPTWQTMNIVPAVYYVATNGQDRADYGKTWDQPWLSIKYACDFVREGTLYPGAKQLLEANKEWIIEETFQYLVYEQANGGLSAYTDVLADEAKIKRDAGIIVNGVIYDMSRGGNSQSVSAARLYFLEESNDRFINDATAGKITYILASLNYLRALVTYALNKQEAPVKYQDLNNVVTPIVQVTQSQYFAETNAITDAQSLVDIVITALEAQDKTATPQPNQGLTATIFVKTGTYLESLPIIIPQNVAVIGDELRGVVVQPKNVINTLVTASNSTSHLFTVRTTDGMLDDEPVQFNYRVVNGVQSTIGGVDAGVNYYVIGSSVTDTQFAVTATLNDKFTCSTTVNSDTLNNVFDFTGLTPGVPLFGPGIQPGTVVVSTDQLAASVLVSKITTATSNSVTVKYGVTLTSDSGTASVVGGDSLKDMFLMRDGTGLRNMSLKGLLGTLSDINVNLTRRPTGPSYTSLDPGDGPNDTRTWILKRSPYVQNVTNFGYGCTGMKVDGNLHNGGNKSIVANDYTQIIGDGIGIWITGPSAVSECVSVFCYYGYTGYLAEDGGRIRATNGNSSYGDYGCIAEGYDVTETPITGNIYNRSQQVQAKVQSSFGTNAELIKFSFANAGSAYGTTTTNLLQYSNNLLSNNWVPDGNVTIAKNIISPSGQVDGWRLLSTVTGSNVSYIYQNVSIQPAGATYTGLSAVNVSGSGLGATFDVTVTSTSYIVTVNTGGSGYVTGNQLFISGGQLGGLNNVNDCIITVDRLAGSSILTVTASGTVPLGSAKNYTLSAYVKKGNASTVDLYGIFSGSSSVTSAITLDLDNGSITPSNANGGFLPTHYGATSLTNGWWRVWFALNDTTGLNSTLQFRIYPRGYNGSISQYNYFYGFQMENSASDYKPSFYLETANDRYTSYANYQITGAGTGALALGDEIRSRSIFETRVTDPGSGAGGQGYLTASNNAQAGSIGQIQIAQSDINTAANYVGMRVFINSGTGAGQYGYISAYEENSKYAQVLKESFDTIKITATNSATGEFTIDSTDTTETIYVDQAIQFIPTYYTINISSVSQSTQSVTEIIGGTTNVVKVADTTQMTVNMPVLFSGTVLGAITPNYTYFISAIIDSTSIQISSQIYGTAQQLVNATVTAPTVMNINFPSNTSYISGQTDNMQVNLPIQFTGTSVGGINVGRTYYINDIIDGGAFTIAGSVTTVTPTASSSSSNAFTVTSTSSLTNLNPIVFSGNVFGNVVEGTKYYISKIINANTFSISDSLITVNATATEAVSNLITVLSTSGFVVNNPIVFVGTTFGGIVAETVYYILAINDAQTFTISQTPGGSALALGSYTGMMYVKTAPSNYPLITTSGSMTATTTSTKTKLTAGSGTLNATFSTTLFGNVVQGTTYYITSVDELNNKFTVSEAQGGSDLILVSKTGSMNIGAVGWDHVNVGKPAESILDSSSVYYIEPRTTFSEPAFSQTSNSIVNLAPGTEWKDIAYGDNYWMALPNGNATAAGSSDGENWTSITLPDTLNWTSIAYGNGYWVAISQTQGAEQSMAARSSSRGQGWRMTDLPADTGWSQVAYGNGIFVAIASNGSGVNSAYSVDFGKTWSTGASLPNADWSGLAYGAGKFVAIRSGSSNIAYTTDGATWVNWGGALPSATTWSDIAYGNGRFVAISNTFGKSAYSFDGITWYESDLPMAADKISYGQGVFVAVNNPNGDAYTSEGGETWRLRAVSDDSYTAIAFGYSASTGVGVFVTAAGRNTGSNIFAGAKTKGRAIVTSGVITSISQWEPGSNYIAQPTVTFTDPNVTSLASVTPRIGNGALGNPTWMNNGSGYNTNSTSVKITGNGYADAYQTGLTLIMNNLTKLPLPGDNLEIAGNSNVYKVTRATAVYGTTAPNIEANVEIAPDMSVALSPDNGAAVTIRQKYSQVRLTGHDFLNIGYGNVTESNYPGYPIGTDLQQQNQTVETNYGRVFYTSTDQDGNFKVGGLFGVEQATGIVTLSASQFGLTGLETLSLGGIAVGGSSVVVRQFSTDSAFIANSDNIVPTQKAIKAYLESRLSQGGANTFTGQLTAGTTVVGGPNKIRSTIPNGYQGSSVNMLNKVNFVGEFAGVDGGMSAMFYFMKHFSKR